MPHYEPIIGIDGFKLVSIRQHGIIEITVEYLHQAKCPKCGNQRLRKKDSFWRRIKHHSIGNQRCLLLIKAHKFFCLSCGCYFNQRFAGIRPRYQCTEPFREEVSQKHHWGFSKAKGSEVLGISSSSLERHYQAYLSQRDSHRQNASCPKILGIDEKHFTRKKGYMTTLCDLKRHKVFDVTLGRSELALREYLIKLKDKDNCRVILMDLSETYRSLAKAHFQKAVIVADRFHVVKLINHHFLKTWSDLDEVGRKNRGLLSLMRRHPENLKPDQAIRLRNYLKQNPSLEAVYDFKQWLMRIILSRVSSKAQARRLIPDFLTALGMLRESPFRSMKVLGETLERWQQEIVRMWRFSKTNSITEGLHNRMEEIIRRAYGFRNFNNFRLRVLEYCS